MSNLLRSAVTGIFVGCLFAVSAYAQDVTAAQPAPANLSYIDGAVDLIQDGASVGVDPPMMLLDGDVVRTRNGRAEIVFNDGTLLHLASTTELEILGDHRLRIVSGRAMIRVSRAASRAFTIDTPAAAVDLAAEGEYELEASDERLEVGVARGTASVADVQQWTLTGGQMITLPGPAGRPLIAAYNSAQWDAFELWAYERTNGIAASASASQLPAELRPYAPVLEHYGRWDYVAPHGYVWFPAVATSWRPYSNGSWSFSRYGWTWRGHDRWTWPTHHYGRWGYTGAFWYWMPGVVWAPAWVSWSVAPGYVSWAPLGWHTASYYDPWGRIDHPAYWPNYNPWRGWTVLPRQHFGPGRSVRAYAVEGDRLDEPTRRVLLSTATPTRPFTDVAVPKDAATGPGARGGNVRRPQPAPQTRPGDAAAPKQRGDDPAYTPPSSWSGVATRVDGRGDSGAGERRSTPKSGDRDSGAVQRRGAGRDPGARATTGGDSGSEPRGGVKNPGAGARQGQSSTGSAAGAVARKPRG